MKITFFDVFHYLNLNIDQKFNESADYLESVFLSNSDGGAFGLKSDDDYGKEYFLVYDTDLGLYFNRVRNFIFKVLNFPLKINKLSESCGNLISSLLSLTGKIINQSSRDNFCNMDTGETNQRIDVGEYLNELKKTIHVIGNWKNLPSNLLDSKCSTKEKLAVENVYTIGFHAMLSAQNICLYLVFYLSQMSFVNKNYMQTIKLNVCSFANETNPLNEEESCMFIQNCFICLNNFFHLHLYQFKKNCILNESESNSNSTLSCKGINSSQPVSTLHCECLGKCWYLAFKLMRSFDSNGYFTKIQDIFWQSLNRIINKIKYQEKEDELSNMTISNLIYFQSEAKKTENLSLTILFLVNDILNSIRMNYDQLNQMAPANFEDAGYQLIKVTLKEIVDQNQSANRNALCKLNMAIQLMCNLISRANNTINTSYTSDLSISSQLLYEKNLSISINSQKTLVDNLIVMWEAYFCKNLNCSFNMQSNMSTSSLLDNNNTNEFKPTISLINQICSTNEILSGNIYHLFLKYLYFNLRDNQLNLSSSINNSSMNTSTQMAPGSSVTLVWRQFKGRLYTRLHDKRIAELDLNGLVNVSHLFFVLIKCFGSCASSSSSSSSSINMNQLKYEQLENFYRILNVFIRAKNLHKIDSILALSSTSVQSNASISLNSIIQAKINTIKIICNLKFVALRLWFDANDSSCLKDTNEDLTNEDVDSLMKQEFIDWLNVFLADAINYSNNKSTDPKDHKDLNQISSFKNSQMINQFLCDVFANFVDNCKYFMYKSSPDMSTSISSSTFYPALYNSCKFLNEIKYDTLFSLLSRKQNELIFSRLTDILATFKRLMQNDIQLYVSNTKLATLMSEFILKLWTTLISHQNSINISTVFSYDLIANIHYELCSLYSYLFYKPEEYIIEQQTSKEIKQLTEMIEHFLTPNHVSLSHGTDDFTHLTTIRIKFVANVLGESSLFDLSQKNVKFFDSKLINLIVFAYLSSSRSETSANTSNSTANLVEKELINFVNICAHKLDIFVQLDVKLTTDIEQLINDFIKKFSFNIKQLQNFNERKIQLDHLNVYFHDFLKIINSLGSINTHSIIYKCYLLASQIVMRLAVYIHSRGKSDTIFAKIIDKMVLPVSLSKNTPNTVNAKGQQLTTSANVATANNQNSLLMSLKDTLHLFLIGISELNYEYDGYLQRVIQNVVQNYSFRFNMLKHEDHFLVLAIESSFYENPSNESVCFREYLLKILKQTFITDLKYTVDCEKCLSLVHYIMTRTGSDELIVKDSEIFFTSVLVLLGNDNNTLKTKALTMFNFIMKKINTPSSAMSKCVENVINFYWNQLEPSKIFVSLCMVAKQKPGLVTEFIKDLIIDKVEESQSKFLYNTELKNTLFTFFEYLDGDQGKIYLNKRLKFLYN